MEPVHIVCIFELFCRMGEPCFETRETIVNLRYQTDALFAEVWIGEAPQVPWPAILTVPGGFTQHLSFFVSGDMAYTQLVTLNPDTLAATYTTHLPAPGLGAGPLDAVSSQTTCAVAEDRL